MSLEHPSDEKIVATGWWGPVGRFSGPEYTEACRFYEDHPNKASYPDWPAKPVFVIERELLQNIFKTANNALYFADSSDYRSALYEAIEVLIVNLIEAGFSREEKFESNNEWTYDSKVSIHGISMRPALKKNGKIMAWVDLVNITESAILNIMNHNTIKHHENLILRIDAEVLKNRIRELEDA
jgi:hypothetical protein